MAQLGLTVLLVLLVGFFPSSNRVLDLDAKDAKPRRITRTPDPRPMPASLTDARLAAVRSREVDPAATSLAGDGSLHLHGAPDRPVGGLEGRVEAVTGDNAVALMQSLDSTLSAAASALKVQPVDLPAARVSPCVLAVTRTGDRCTRTAQRAPRPGRGGTRRARRWPG